MVAVAAVVAAVLLVRGNGDNPDDSSPSGTDSSTSPRPSLSIPSELPSRLPSELPTSLPSGFPTDLPSGFPTDLPSGFPSGLESLLPSLEDALP
ncbi:Secreted protein OS=Streptomyces viridochromogenes OX=1938 GN=ACM01_08310 PE=4 SV=1 [Streptomyces viridochromogenes]